MFCHYLGAMPSLAGGAELTSETWNERVDAFDVEGLAGELEAVSAPYFASFTAAMKAGNPDSIVAFNPGVLVPVVCHAECEDYTAGEISEAFPVCPGAWVERNGHRARYHILSYLGTSWCQGDRPRFPDDFVTGYTRHVNEKGGVVTWDVPILASGLIPQPFVSQLGALRGRCGSAWPTC